MDLDHVGSGVGRRPIIGTIRNKVTYYRHDPTRILAIVLIVGLAYLVLAPVAAMLSDAFRVSLRDSQSIGAPVGAFTTAYFERTFSEDISRVIFWDPLRRTLVVAFLSSGLALFFGLVLAWLVTGTDIIGRRLLGSLLILPYMLPSWAFAVAWRTAFKNRRLAGSEGFAETLGFSPPDWLAYGAVPMVIALALHYFPFAFLLYANGFRRIDSQLEESARSLGASRGTILRRILLPLLLPATMSAILLTFSRTLGTFGTPYLLGTPVQYTLLSTSLYSNFRSGSPGVSAALAGVLVVLGVLIVATDVYVVRQWRRFVTVGGKGGSRRPLALRRWRLPLTAFGWGVLLVSAIVPFAVILLSTVMRIPGVFEFSNFSAQFWLSDSLSIAGGEAGVLRNDNLIQAAFNSLRIAGLAAVVCGALGLVIGYVIVRLPGSKSAGYLRQVSFLPYLLPGIAFAAAALSLFAVQRGPIPSLYGTLSLLVVAMIVMYLPYASRSGISAMMQIGKEPEEAAMVVGASFTQRIGRIILPMQRGPLTVGVLLPFITGMKELSLVVMLVTPGTHLLTTQALSYADLGFVQLSNAAILVIGLTTAVTTWIVQRVSGSALADGLQR